MREAFVRLEMLIGSAAMEWLEQARVAVFGLGGVGGYVVEALARSGIGALDLVDDDKVCLSNLNRQIISTVDVIGRQKTEVAAQRVRSINPDVRLTVHNTFFLPETADQFDFSQFDYVADCIDTVTGKLTLVQLCQAAGTPLISAMGTGNKLDPTKLRVSDVYETFACPLARIMRKELRKRGVKNLKVVWSSEEPMAPILPPPPEKEDSTHSTRRSTPASTAFVPPAAGLLMASVIVRELTAQVNPVQAARGK